MFRIVREWVGPAWTELSAVCVAAGVRAKEDVERNVEGPYFLPDLIVSLPNAVALSKVERRIVVIIDSWTISK